MRLHSYDSGARLTQTVDSLTYPGLSTQYDFVRQQSFDAAGNVEWRGEHEHETSGEWYDHLRSYYGADDKLALANRHIGISAVTDDSRAGTRGVWEMSRYDAWAGACRRTACGQWLPGHRDRVRVTRAHGVGR